MKRETAHASLEPGEQSATTVHTVYLALGSNLGDRQAHLAQAIQHLRAIMEVESVSSIYETLPIGYVEQPAFLNLVCRGKTQVTAEHLLKELKALEIILGRVPSFQNGPRLIDIDILFYDHRSLVQEHLIIPHPRMHERAFVLVPLAEIAPEIVDPVSGKSVRELLAAISQAGVSKYQ